MLIPSSPRDIDELIRTAPSGYTPRPRMRPAEAVGGVAANAPCSLWSPPAVTDPTATGQPPADAALGDATALGVAGPRPAATSKAAVVVPRRFLIVHRPLCLTDQMLG